MPDRNTSNDPAADQPVADGEQPAEPPAEPLNRAERRAQRRGRKPVLPPTDKGPHVGHRDRVVPRRSGRRGNR